MAESADASAATSVDRESYAYRYGYAVTLLRDLVDPPDYIDLEREKQRARRFLAEDAEIEARRRAEVQAWLREPRR